MHLYMTIDGSDELEQLSEPVSSAITNWIGTNKKHIQLINKIAQEISELPDEALGIEITVQTKNALRKPLEFLYGLAKEHKCEFVIGVFHPQTGAKEDVCYFGHDEGRPDVDEIANYLEL